MSDYISRSALLKKMFPYEGIDKKTYSINAKAVELAIVDAPAAYAVEVVRCKNCEFYDVFGLKCLHPRHMIVMGIDDFCSHGEREGKG